MLKEGSLAVTGIAEEEDETYLVCLDQTEHRVVENGPDVCSDCELGVETTCLVVPMARSRVGGKQLEQSRVYLRGKHLRCQAHICAQAPVIPAHSGSGRDQRAGNRVRSHDCIEEAMGGFGRSRAVQYRLEFAESPH